MDDDYGASLFVVAGVSAILALVASSLWVNQVVDAKMWKESENICKENGGVLGVVADSFHWVAHCSNGVSKEFYVK